MNFIHPTADIGEGARVTKSIISIIGLHWRVDISDNHMQIGCQHHLTSDWLNFDAHVIDKMDIGALDCWKTLKPALQALIAARK